MMRLRSEGIPVVVFVKMAPDEIDTICDETIGWSIAPEKPALYR